MAGKKKSAKSAKSRKGSSRGASGKKKGKKSAKSRASSAGTVKSEREPDMMDPPAMENLYYIAHGPVDALEIRGFGWSDAPKKKGKKGKKKK